MYVCMYVCMYVYIHTYIHTYIHIYIHTCMHACMHAYIRTYKHTYSLYIHRYRPTDMQAYIHRARDKIETNITAGLLCIQWQTLHRRLGGEAILLGTSDLLGRIIHRQEEGFDALAHTIKCRTRSTDRYILRGLASGGMSPPEYKM